MIIEVAFISEPEDTEDFIPMAGKIIRIEGVDIKEDQAFYASTSNFINELPDGKKELTGKGAIEIRAKGNIPIWKEKRDA